MGEIPVSEIKFLLGLTASDTINYFKSLGLDVNLETPVEESYTDKILKLIFNGKVDYSDSQAQKFSAKIEEHTHKLEVDFDDYSTLYSVHGDLNHELLSLKESIDSYNKVIMEKKETFEKHKLLPVLSAKTVAVELTNALIEQGENFKTSFSLINTSVLLCAYNISKMKKISDYIQKMTGEQLINEQDFDVATDFLLDYMNKTETILKTVNDLSENISKFESELDVAKVDIEKLTDNVNLKLLKMSEALNRAQDSISTELYDLKTQYIQFIELQSAFNEHCENREQQLIANLFEITKKQEDVENHFLDQLSSIYQNFNENIKNIKEQQENDIGQIHIKMVSLKKNSLIAYIIAASAICVSIISLVLSFAK